MSQPKEVQHQLNSDSHTSPCGDIKGVDFTACAQTYNPHIKFYYWGVISKAMFDTIRHDLQDSREKVVLENKPGQQWFVAVFESTQEVRVIGCACILVMGDVCRLKCDIVHKDYRKQGIYNALFDMRMRVAQLEKYRQIDTFASPHSIGTYERNGFVRIRQTNKQPTFYLKYNGQ